MAEWTPISELQVTVGDLPRAAQMNALLENLQFLYEPPACAVRLTSPQTIPDSTDTTISWDQAVWDSVGTMWDAGSPTKIVIPRNGLYLIALSTLWGEVPADRSKRGAFLQVNGTRRRGTQLAAVNPSEWQFVACTTLGEGDELDIEARQLSGQDLDLLPTTGRTVMTVAWIRTLPFTIE